MQFCEMGHKTGYNIKSNSDIHFILEHLDEHQLWYSSCEVSIWFMTKETASLQKAINVQAGPDR